MRLLLKIVSRIALFLLLLGSNTLLGQNNKTFIGEFTARIGDKPSVPSLSIHKLNDVEFGSIVPANIVGSVTIDPINEAITHSNVTLLSSSEIRQSATFTINGTPNQSISVAFSAAYIELSAPGVSEKLKYTMTKNNIISIGNDGSATLKVGGTLEVKANQTAGKYTGTFNVTVNYN